MTMNTAALPAARPRTTQFLTHPWISVWRADGFGARDYFDRESTVAVALAIFRNGWIPAHVASMVYNDILYAVPAVRGVPSSVPDDRNLDGCLSGGRFILANGSVWELLADNDLCTRLPGTAGDEASFNVCATLNGLPSGANVMTSLIQVIRPIP